MKLQNSLPIKKFKERKGQTLFVPNTIIMDNAIGLFVIIAIQVIGGLCLFLFGMNLMGDSLEKTAGMKMQKIIESLTGNLIKGVLVGALVTAVIQSSSATTVMVVGFVSAGIMTLVRSIACRICGAPRASFTTRRWWIKPPPAGWTSLPPKCAARC